MKAFVITIDDNTKSVEAAKRCIHTAREIGGIDVMTYSAATPRNTNAIEYLRDEGISTSMLKEKYSRFANCASAFISHYSLWKMCITLGEPILILEHDAVFVDQFPELVTYPDIMNIGRPSYGKFNVPKSFGVQPLVSKPYFGGAHGYVISPEGARKAIWQAKTEGAKPTDLFFNSTHFPNIKEYYPWVVEARDTFTTIQAEAGCLAKHNYGVGYEIL